MPRCGALSRRQGGPSSVAKRTMRRAARKLESTSSLSRTKQDTPELMHGLALTNFPDCNTRCVECSTCYVPSNDTTQHNTATATTAVQHAEVLNGNHDTDTNQGKCLIIYLNSLVHNLCLYTVNSATTLQRITFTLRTSERC